MNRDRTAGGLESARALNAILAANFEEFQIFRTDHYVGKETVQNILAFRSWGRKEADALLAREGHAWRLIA